MRFHQKKKRSPVINIVSLIDILCLLLIFFIVTTTFKKDEPVVKIDLPESSQAQKTGDTDVPSILSVNGPDQVFLDGKQISLADLAETLRQRSAEKPGWKVAMRADKAAAFGTIIKIMDAAKSAGIRQLPTITEEAKPGTP
jgi:biopolymer transport protein ExbD